MGSIAVVAVADGVLHVGLLRTEGEDTIERAVVSGIMDLVCVVVGGVGFAALGRRTAVLATAIVGVASMSVARRGIVVAGTYNALCGGRCSR